MTKYLSLILSIVIFTSMYSCATPKNLADNEFSVLEGDESYLCFTLATESSRDLTIKLTSISKLFVIYHYTHKVMNTNLVVLKIRPGIYAIDRVNECTFNNQSMFIVKPGCMNWLGELQIQKLDFTANPLQFRIDYYHIKFNKNTNENSQLKAWKERNKVNLETINIEPESYQENYPLFYPQNRR